MQFVRSHIIGWIVAGLLFSTAAQAQHIQLPGAQTYRPIWHQFTPINVYHDGFYHGQSISIANYYNGVEIRALSSSGGVFGGIVPAPPMDSMIAPSTDATALPVRPAEPVPNETANGSQNGDTVINADQAPMQSAPVVDVPATNVPESNSQSDAVDQSHPGDTRASSGGPNRPVIANQQLETPLADERQDKNDDKGKRDLKIARAANDQADDQGDPSKELKKLKNQLARKTKALANLRADHKRLKQMLEQQILTLIKEKQDGEVTKEIDNLKKQNAELQAVNDQLRQQAKTSLQEQKLLAKKVAERGEKPKKAKAAQQVKPDDSKKAMTLGQLAEIKRAERNNRASSTSDASAEQSLRVEMQSQIKRSVNKIRNRFQRKMDQVSEQDNGSEQAARLEDEMNVQIEKMKKRIKNRFKPRMDSTQSKSR